MKNKYIAFSEIDGYRSWGLKKYTCGNLSEIPVPDDAKNVRMVVEFGRGFWVEFESADGDDVKIGYCNND